MFYRRCAGGPSWSRKKKPGAGLRTFQPCPNLPCGGKTLMGKMTRTALQEAAGMLREEEEDPVLSTDLSFSSAIVDQVRPSP
ncbi:hypothetical protein lerEdw1_005780 [Lerista edwardsae]|nr:hypothetical protein lerEdw1_005780 [Lerista edwardsae]